MVNLDLIGALKSALSRGYSLEIAKQTLVNSGYSLVEINEAASILKTGEQPIPQQISQPVQQIHQTSQKVSAYENVKQNQQKTTKEKSSKILVITLIIILAVLLGILVAFLLFKEQLTAMLS